MTKTGGNLSTSLLRGAELTPCSDDEEDETAELLRELEKIKKERAEQREREVCILTPRALVPGPQLSASVRNVRRKRKSRRSGNTTLPLAILCSTPQKISASDEGRWQCVIFKCAPPH